MNFSKIKNENINLKENKDFLKDENAELRERNEEYEEEYKNLEDRLNKKDKLNKRLINVLTIYKYHELNNVQKYDYNEIKQKNKKLNLEFKRVAKLMKLNM